jgi:hypothetical protein
MKIWTSKYRSHWVSPYRLAERLCFWREIDYDEPWVKALNRVTEPVCYGLQWFLDKIHPRIVYVKIDPWDTWSMDHTLAEVILPMLKQLKATKHGSPFIDDEDVPVHLQSEGYKKGKRRKKKGVELQAHALDMGDEDSTIHDRWDWVLNEEIWAFEQMLDDSKGEDKFFDHSNSGGLPWSEDYVAPKCDWDGLKAHQARMQNGFRLFGKYYLAHWD